MSDRSTKVRDEPAKQGRRPAPEGAFYLCSYPKCGRTWLRFIVANYLVSTFELGLEIDFRTVFQVLPNDGENAERGRPAYRFADDDRVPLILSRHGPYGPRFAGHPLLTIVRSPLDTLVSRYFALEHHRGKRSRSMHEHLREEDVGVADLVAYYNSWAGPLVNGRSLVLSYERLREEPKTELESLWPFLGLATDDEAVDYAIEQSRFENLQKLEEQEQIPGFEYDVNDPEARRVRRGKIGGWRDYIDEAEAEYVRERCRADLNDDAKALLRPFWPDILTG